MKKNIHTVPFNGDWAVKEVGIKTPLSVHSTKDRAQIRGRLEAIMRSSEHVIHGRNGKIQDKDSYGRDPFPPKDRVH